MQYEPVMTRDEYLEHVWDWEAPVSFDLMRTRRYSRQLVKSFRLDRWGITPEDLAHEGYEDLRALIGLVGMLDVMEAAGW